MAVKIEVRIRWKVNERWRKARKTDDRSKEKAR